ncbi:MAG: hypothetical protein R3D88_02000 [Alphaproteobacteria bacterium]
MINTRYYKHIEKMEYDLRFQSFLTKIMNISNLYPRDQHLYPLMDKVAFKDLETAMIVVIQDFAAEASNDNKSE